MCLVAYSDGKEVQGFQLVIQSISDNKHLNTIFSVESSPNVSMAFTNAYPEWREGTYENFKDWSLKQFDAEKLDSDDEAEIPAHMQKAKDIEFKKDGNGEFILPPKTEFKTNRAKQRVVRGYLGAVYSQYILLTFFFFLIWSIGDFTGYDKAAFPYLLAGEEGQKLFSPDCVPDGFILIDPDHLKAFEIDALYSHWLRRQSKGLSPFIILQSSPQHGVLRKKSEKAKGKNKIDYVEVDMDDEEVKTSEDEEVDKNANEMEELDEEIPAVVRFGPPGGNRKKTKTIENPSQAAGPSKLSPVKKSSEPKTKKGSKTRPVRFVYINLILVLIFDRKSVGKKKRKRKNPVRRRTLTMMMYPPRQGGKSQLEIHRGWVTPSKPATRKISELFLEAKSWGGRGGSF